MGHWPCRVEGRGGSPGVSRLSSASSKGRRLRVASSHSASGCAPKCQRLSDPSPFPLRSEGRVGGPWGSLPPEFQGAPDPGHLSTSRRPGTPPPTPPPLCPHLGHRSGPPGGPTRAPRARLLPAPPPVARGLAEGLLQNYPVPKRPCCDAGSLEVSSFPPDKFRSWAQGRTRAPKRQKPGAGAGAATARCGREARPSPAWLGEGAPGSCGSRLGPTPAA